MKRKSSLPKSLFVAITQVLQAEPEFAAGYAPFGEVADI
jgi:hypothetical protein